MLVNVQVCGSVIIVMTFINIIVMTIINIIVIINVTIIIG